MILKNTLILFVFATALIFTSCKKNETSKPIFADIEFTIYDLRPPGDSDAAEVTYPSTIILKSDYTWTIDLGGAESNGTYSWAPNSNQQGDIRFAITKWADFTSNPILSDKLKSALLAVKRYGCFYPLQTSSFLNFLVQDCQCDNFPFIRTSKK